MSNIYDSMHSASCCISIDDELSPKLFIFSFSSGSSPAHGAGGQVYCYYSTNRYKKLTIVMAG